MRTCWRSGESGIRWGVRVSKFRRQGSHRQMARASKEMNPRLHYECGNSGRQTYGVSIFEQPSHLEMNTTFYPTPIGRNPFLSRIKLCCPIQSYEIKLPPQPFLDGRFSPWRKLRQVGCYDVAKFRLVTIDSCALIHSCLLFTNLNFATS